MRILKSQYAKVVGAVFVVVSILFGFQNCAQPGSIQSDGAKTENNSASSPIDCATYKIPGSGTPASPYQIGSEEAYKCISTSDELTKDKSWVLTKDLDFSSYSGVRLMIPFFRGSLDGQYHRIKNFHIDCVTDPDLCVGSIGIFGEVNRSTIKNLFVENVRIEAPAANYLKAIYQIGGLVGLLSQQSTLQRISIVGTFDVKGDVNDNSLFGVGLLAGFVSESVVSESKASGAILGHSTPYSIGALVGRACQLDLQNSYAKADIYGGWFTGGLAGGCGNGGSTYKVSNSFYIGNLTLEPGHWSQCSYVAPLGTAQGEALTEGRTKIANSFWQGTSSCSPIFYQDSAPSFSAEWVANNFNVDPNIWHIRTTDWPELKWIEVH